MAALSEHKVFHLGDMPLQRGGELRLGRLAYKTYGVLSPKRDNVILYPTHYTGDHTSNEAMIGPGRALDTDRFFIIVPNMFGNGLSSSPSNAESEQRDALFPEITVYDNVLAQQRLLREVWGVTTLKLVCGWSMGGQQAYHWAALFPDSVRRLFCCCGSARTSPLNWVFLEGVKATLQLNSGLPPDAGLKAFGRVYAGWAYSPEFFRREMYREAGFDSIEALLRYWEQDHLTWNPYDLLAMLNTWQLADLSDNAFFRGDLLRALSGITAKSIIMPSETDRYFCADDNREEVRWLPNAEYIPIPSHWGHMAGSPARGGKDREHVENALRRLLDEALGDS